MSKKDVHTTPNPKGSGWVNQVGGQVISQYPTKEKAVEQGKAVAQQNKSEHVIHGQDGTIKEKNSYGNDPFPPRDKK